MSRWYGSFQNRLMENSNKEVVPEVGMGVTECCWSDRHPWEVIEVKDDRHIVIRRMDYKRVDNYGMSDVQDYEYTSNPENGTATLFKTKQGRWRRRYGARRLDNSTGWCIGFAEEHYDFSF